MLFQILVAVRSFVWINGPNESVDVSEIIYICIHTCIYTYAGDIKKEREGILILYRILLQYLLYLF